jgi:hypothetical protein
MNINTKNFAKFTGDKKTASEKNAEMYRDASENRAKIRKLINFKSEEVNSIISEIESIRTSKEFQNIDKISEYLLKINLTDIINTQSDLVFKPYYLTVSKVNKNYKLFICSKNHEYVVGEGYDNFNYSLNIIEIYQMLTNTKTYTQALVKIMSKTKIKINKKEEDFMNNEKIKYANNQLLIRNKIKDYIYIDKLIGDYTLLLEEINFINLDTSVNKKKSVKGQNVFFAPVRVLEGRMKEICRQLDVTANKMNKTNINKAINVFLLLGLVKEVDKNKIKDEFKLEKTNEFYYDTNWYSMPSLDDKILTNANKISEKLIDNKITVANISQDKLKNVK